MGIYDQRVFFDGGNWWVAEVRNSSSSAFGLEGTQPESPQIPDQRPHDVGLMMLDNPLTIETVVFTCLNNKGALSVWSGIQANSLGRLSHPSIVWCLQHARACDRRIEMVPHNPPNPDAFELSHLFVDDTGLRWGYKEIVALAIDDSGTVLRKSAVNCTCLDDSALQNTVLLPGTSLSIAETSQASGADLLPVLAAAIQDLFVNVEPPSAQVAPAESHLGLEPVRG